MIASDFFSQPVPRSHIDDLVYRRMIKSCAHLQCYTQAAVLCQFLEEVDYSLAFKMAASDQKSSTSADAMDAYYHCIWDTTILEYLINLHTKRGEHHRKQLAVSEKDLQKLQIPSFSYIFRFFSQSHKFPIHSEFFFPFEKIFFSCALPEDERFSYFTDPSHWSTGIKLQ